MSFSYPRAGQAVDAGIAAIFLRISPMDMPRNAGSHRSLLSLARALGFLLATGIYGWAQTPVKPLPLLTHADQIRELSPEQAAIGYPVRIRGTITDDVPAPDFFVQDSTAGIYVEGSRAPTFTHHFGDLVEVEGITGPGRFAPVIREQKLRVLGKGTLPDAKLYPFSELADGQMDSQWVRVRGIVRSVSIDRTSWHETVLAMRIASGDGEFHVRVPISEERDFSSWVDTGVLIEGVCGSLSTFRRQLSGVLFYVPRLKFIRIEAPANRIPFSSLLLFSPAEGARHRVRVRGVVSYQQLGNAVFLQGEGKGLRVRTQQETPLQIGDIVDVLGFPVTGESAPVLTDAVMHRVGHGPPPVPIELDLAAPWEQYDGALVSTDAILLERRQQAGGLRLLLRAGETIFEATLAGVGGVPPHSSIRLNSTVRVTGICLVRSGGLWSVPQSFRLLLRSPGDIAVLRAPSWWNLKHTLWLLGATVTILLLVVAWVMVLGRRLREQMHVIHQKLQMGAVLEERNRIARELHDTLEQELAGITMQLDLAVDCLQNTPQVARQAVEAARNMSRHSMIEARRSVWDLRCQLLENGDLVSALTEIATPLAERKGATIDVQITGRPVRLDGSIEMNLLRIGQEAVANAVKHSGAHHILIELHYDKGTVGLSVSDDGHGFDPEQTPATGHFGLLDMRERAHCLGCILHVESQPGRGTRITASAPLKERPSPDEELKTHTYSGG